jgi:hypothetical protein
MKNMNRNESEKHSIFFVAKNRNENLYAHQEKKAKKYVIFFRLSTRKGSEMVPVPVDVSL